MATSKNYQLNNLPLEVKYCINEAIEIYQQVEHFHHDVITSAELVDEIMAIKKKYSKGE